MFTLIVGFVCLLAGGAGGFLWGSKVKNTAVKVAGAVSQGASEVKKAL